MLNFDDLYIIVYREVSTQDDNLYEIYRHTKGGLAIYTRFDSAMTGLSYAKRYAYKWYPYYANVEFKIIRIKDINEISKTIISESKEYLPN